MTLLIIKGKIIHLACRSWGSLDICSIYVELAEEYKHMDAVSDPPRRNILARHLREVIGLLEQRVSLTIPRHRFSC